ncbi:hypothetical protein KUTeg_012595 [Tegillarca granosa]|uniref:CCHC-type domain-containing protein n=1 Tax=Tegillarca granosa TaxID=220873 RepID=A0ABQ9EZY0_TEGGR|nr:hypothetical protein KUTeg_012595 [Tegillarca granosa]
MADSSEFGWRTVEEYCKNPLASDSDDEKCIYRSEGRAGKKVREEKRKKLYGRRSAPYPANSQERLADCRTDANSNRQAPKRPGSCFACGEQGHWKWECTKQPIVVVDSTEITKFVGQIISMSPVLGNEARFGTRGMYNCILDRLGWNSQVYISSEALGEAIFWLQNIDNLNNCSIGTQTDVEYALNVFSVSSETEIDLNTHIRNTITASGFPANDETNDLHVSVKLTSYLLNSRIDNTYKKKYISAFSKWSKYIRNKGHNATPANPVHIALYMTHLPTISKVAYQTLCSVKYSIKWVHSLLGLADPTEHSFITNILESGKRLPKPQTVKKEPVSTDNLVSLCSFYSGIRICKSKTDQYRLGDKILVSKCSTVACPLTMLRQYFKLANIDNSSHHFLFSPIFRSGSKPPIF